MAIDENARAGTIIGLVVAGAIGLCFGGIFLCLAAALAGAIAGSILGSVVTGLEASHTAHKRSKNSRDTTDLSPSPSQENSVAQSISKSERQAALEEHRLDNPPYDRNDPSKDWEADDSFQSRVRSGGNDRGGFGR